MQNLQDKIESQLSKSEMQDNLIFIEKEKNHLVRDNLWYLLNVFLLGAIPHQCHDPTVVFGLVAGVRSRCARMAKSPFSPKVIALGILAYLFDDNRNW